MNRAKGLARTALRLWNAVARAACIIALTFSRVARRVALRSIAFETALNRAARRLLSTPRMAVLAAARCFIRRRESDRKAARLSANLHITNS
jgi:hypothetical protein